MKRLLRALKLAALVILPLAVIYFGWSSFRASRERLAREDAEQSSLKYKQDSQRAVQRQAQTENARRLSAQRKPLSKPQLANNNRIKNVNLRHVAFSPDGRFLAAAAQYQSVGELIVWPASGSATLLRKKFDFANSLVVDWNAKNTLIADGAVLRIHKDKGFWDASELPRPFPTGQPMRVDRYRNFPHQDVRLQIENATTSAHNSAFSGHRLAAYSLATRVNLPLPPALESQRELQDILPLARWGKAPLRLVQWKSLDGPGSSAQSTVNSALEVWDARAKKRLWQKSFPTFAGKLLIGKEGKFFVAVGTSIRLAQPETYYWPQGMEVYDSLSGKIMAKSRLPEMEKESATISLDGNFLAITARRSDSKNRNQQQIIFVYQARTLKLLRKINLMQIEKTASEIAFSPDNSVLAVAIGDTIRLYNWRSADAAGKTPFKIAWF